jgi:hypothetical protein
VVLVATVIVANLDAFSTVFEAPLFQHHSLQLFIYDSGEVMDSSKMNHICLDD